ncbi:MAG: Asp-tRNA(Asn)/Glu-tRNA(Gln) amidotransferase subunit GatA, partial [Sulfurovaceae bacterium]|nr:Asp-tRNA(Asn)/Glu-tRNA(Gln) amidotransferase subunit GatA [Sulfurovaceae bacterium]
MITLKEALTKSKEELDLLKIEMEKNAKEGGLNAYIDFASFGEGIPILIKDNIQVKGWSVTAGSQILQGYVAPYNATVIKNLQKNGFSAFG